MAAPPIDRSHNRARNCKHKAKGAIGSADMSFIAVKLFVEAGFGIHFGNKSTNCEANEGIWVVID